MNECPVHHIEYYIFCRKCLNNEEPENENPIQEPE